MASSLTACLLWAGSSVAFARAQEDPNQRPGTSTVFVLHALSIPSNATSAAARGINRHGLVVGNAVVSSGAQAEIWRLGPSGAELNRVDLHPPSGYRNAQLVAVNDSGTSVGTVYGGDGASGEPSEYVSVHRGKGWTVLRWKPATQGTGEAIASGGSIAADILNARSGMPEAAIIPFSTPKAYAAYHFLPLNGNAHESGATSIVSTKGRTVVGGYEDMPVADGGVAPRAAVWVDGRGPYLVPIAKLKLNQPGSVLTSLYATNGTVYGAGYGFESVSGVSWTEPWALKIGVAKTLPAIGSPVSLPIPPYASFGTAVTIGAAAGGMSGRLAVGGNISDLAGATGAALWTIDTSGKEPSVQSFTDVAGMQTGSSVCPGYEIETINANGTAAGSAVCNGHIHPISLQPHG